MDEISGHIILKGRLDLLPGRLSTYNFENKISERWPGIYMSDPLSIRTVTKIREIAESYSKKFNYDYVIIDTSPSLGSLNKVIISTVDGFLIPCWPDMFSLYGIRNIGQSLSKWHQEFTTLYRLISGDKRKLFPKQFVRFLGYTIYNAKKYTGVSPWDLSQAHYNYAMKIPETIGSYISPQVRTHLEEDIYSKPIGETAIMHSHNTLPNMAQKYHHPIWEIPGLSSLESSDSGTIAGNRRVYESTKERYTQFANDLISRMDSLGE